MCEKPADNNVVFQRDMDTLVLTLFHNPLQKAQFPD